MTSHTDLIYAVASDNKRIKQGTGIFNFYCPKCKKPVSICVMYGQKSIMCRACGSWVPYKHAMKIRKEMKSKDIKRMTKDLYSLTKFIKEFDNIGNNAVLEWPTEPKYVAIVLDIEKLRSGIVEHGKTIFLLSSIHDWSYIKSKLIVRVHSSMEFNSIVLFE